VRILGIVQDLEEFVGGWILSWLASLHTLQELAAVGHYIVIQRG
jgi:hypothetical protein